MLITCPECTSEVSNKAVSCPKCGYPIISPKKSRRASTKRMRLPNGFGRITEIKGKHLRKPFRVIVSDGKDQYGKPIGRLLKPEAYFATYNEAYQALMKYHEDPYDLSSSVTMQDLYDRWFETVSKTVSKSRRDQISATWNYCEPIKSLDVATIRSKDVRPILTNPSRKKKDGNIIEASDSMKAYIKLTLSSMMDYAIEYELIKYNFVKDIKLHTTTEEAKHHMTFTEDEMKTILSCEGKNITVDMIVFQCYTGMRPGEICSIEISKIDMTGWTLIGGSKTASGKNRVVPIHENIRPLVRRYYNKAISTGSNLLFNTTYAHYVSNFKKEIAALQISPEHRPHDCRKQFITVAKNLGVDEYAIKRIVGHRIADITEHVYTERTAEWLHKEISKIKTLY